MSTVNIGWLKDENGDKFAPKTLASQVFDSNGESINDKILPRITSEDNDKFLKVVDGQWAVVEIPLAKGESF